MGPGPFTRFCKPKADRSDVSKNRGGDATRFSGRKALIR